MNDYNLNGKKSHSPFAQNRTERELTRKKKSKRQQGSKRNIPEVEEGEQRGMVRRKRDMESVWFLILSMQTLYIHTYSVCEIKIVEIILCVCLVLVFFVFWYICLVFG